MALSLCLFMQAVPSTLLAWVKSCLWLCTTQRQYIIQHRTDLIIFLSYHSNNHITAQMLPTEGRKGDAITDRLPSIAGDILVQIKLRRSLSRLSCLYLRLINVLGVRCVKNAAEANSRYFHRNQGISLMTIMMTLILHWVTAAVDSNWI